MNDIKLISIGFYAFGILGIPASFFAPVFMMSRSEIPSEMVIFLVLGIIGSLSLSSCFIVAGYSFFRKKNWMFCYIVSILVLPSIPIGTALGIKGIKVLSNNKDMWKR